MKKVGVIVLTILFLTVISAGIYFLVDPKDQNTLIESSEINTPLENNKITEKELDINSYLVKDLYQKINPSNDAMVLKGLYDNLTPSNAYILAVGAMNYIRKNIPIDAEMVQNHMFTTTISEEDLKTSIYEIFGNIEYQNEDFYVLNSDYGVCGFTYQSEVSRYESLNGCGGSQFESFIRKVVSARQRNNYIYITEKSIYVYADWNEYISRKYIYNNYHQDKMLDYKETSSTESDPITLDPYIDEATTYEYVFENQNGQYIFKELRQL